MASQITRGSTTFNQLQQRGKAIADELDQIAATFNLNHQGARNYWLNQQWANLNLTAPQIDLPYRYTPPRTRTRQIVDSRRIISVTGASGQWGHLNNRPHSFGQILEGLRDAAAVDRWEGWLHAMAPELDPVELIETLGPLGPVYEIGNGGRHRAMFARAAGLPALDAMVISSPLPQAGRPIHWPVSSWPRDRTTRRHYERLRTEGFATLSTIDTQHGPVVAVQPMVDSDTAWAFDPPAHVSAISRAYQRIYPHFGLQPRQAAMLQANLDPDAWLR